MSIINPKEIKEEIVVNLRNADILTTTQRSVTTTTTTGTIAGTATISIPLATVKNIRSLTLGGTAQLFGDDYLVEYEGTNCVVTLTNSATADYSVQYDYGSDKIFSGYPRDDLTINSFPRIAVEYINISSEPGGFGNVNRNRHDLSIVVYDKSKTDVMSYTQLIRNWIINNQNSLYYLPLIKPSVTGPVVIAGEFQKFKDKIVKQNIDFTCILQYEVN